jgi:hypothetical protein
MSLPFALAAAVIDTFLVVFPQPASMPVLYLAAGGVVTWIAFCSLVAHKPGHPQLFYFRYFGPALGATIGPISRLVFQTITGSEELSLGIGVFIAAFVGLTSVIIADLQFATQCLDAWASLGPVPYTYYGKYSLEEAVDVLFDTEGATAFKQRLDLSRYIRMEQNSSYPDTGYSVKWIAVSFLVSYLLCALVAKYVSDFFDVR